MKHIVSAVILALALALGFTLVAQIPIQGTGSGGGSGSSSTTVQNDGVQVGDPRSTMNYVPGLGISWSISDTGSKINIQPNVDASTLPCNVITQFCLSDNFVGTPADVGDRGVYDWSTGGTGSAFWDFTATRPEMKVTTGASSGNGNRVDLSRSSENRVQFTVGVGGALSEWTMIQVIRTSSSVASTSFALGWAGAYSDTAMRTSPAIYARYSTANPACTSGTTSGTTWVFESYASTTSTCADTGVTVTADTVYKFRWICTTLGTVTLEVSTAGGAYSSPVTLATGVPTASVAPFYLVNTLTGSSKEWFLRKWALQGTLTGE